MNILSKYGLILLAVLSSSGVAFFAPGQIPAEADNGNIPAITSVEIPVLFAEPPVRTACTVRVFSQSNSESGSDDNFDAGSKFGRFIAWGASAALSICLSAIHPNQIRFLLYPFHFFL